MLTGLVAHAAPSSPGELWSAWSSSPLAWIALAAMVVLYGRGLGRRRLAPSARGDGRHERGMRARRWRAASAQGDVRSRRHRWPLFTAALLALGLALVSPLDALSGALASAHMAQHLLLIVVAAPLLVIAAAPATMALGLPRSLRHAVQGPRGAVRRHRPLRALRGALALAGLHAVTMWVWHAAGPYEAAVESDLLHALEHTTFLVTAVAAWSAVLHAPRRHGHGAPTAMLALFALSVQSALLGALLTFAPEPWYGTFATTTEPWGLGRLADQQLAGVLMWVPGGVVYLAAALHMLFRWMGSSTAPAPAFVPRVPSAT